MDYNQSVTIELTKQKCDNTGYRAMAVRNDGEMLSGCWTEQRGMVHIEWTAGDSSDFLKTSFYERSMQ